MGPVAEASRSGIGLDLHRFAAGRELWLAGVRFEGEQGLVGHSDGDVVCHAVADALLGAAALGDLGMHFPDDDPSVAGIAGTTLLGRVVSLVTETGLRPASCDVTVLCERPAIAPRREEMRRSLAATLDLPLDRVSVKATRPEGLGLVGDGVGALAIVVAQ